MRTMKRLLLRAQLGLLTLTGLGALALSGAHGQKGSDEDEGNGQTGKDIVITLKNKFINDYKLRATIDTDFTVDMPGKINPPSKDGDMHASGRAKEVGLPIVAELMNAKDMKEGVKALKDAKENGDPIKVSGAWRLWCEHAGGARQIQGKALLPFKTSNPDHVFEIHPITKIGTMSTLESIKVIEGFKPKDAHAAFVHYENVRCRIEPGATTTTIRTGMAGYNYVKFVIEPLEKPSDHKVVKDGRFVMCRVRDLDDELVVRRVRMVFIKGTKPEEAIRNVEMNGRLVVLGLPRINLSLVAWRAQQKGTNDDALTWGLPYEMIIVGAYPKSEIPEQ